MKNPLNACALRGIPRSTRKEDEQPVTTPEAPPHMIHAEHDDVEPDIGVYESEWDSFDETQVAPAVDGEL